MEPETQHKNPVTLVLGCIAGALVLVLALLLVLSIPHMAPETETTLAPTEAPTDPPTEAPTDPPEPTLPPPDANPYGKLDFQYAGRYLKLIEGESLTGIDVSAYQKTIDWVQVKESGVDFAIIRLAYRGYEKGTIVDDKYAAANLEGALAAGLDVGVYFFSQALTVEEAVEEAEYVIEKIAGYNVTMPVVYDWEHVSSEDARTADMHDKELLTQCADAFLKTVEEAGYWPMLYFNRRQSQKLLDIAALKEYDFWLAAYTDRMTFPYKIKMWQYTNEGSVPGIEGDVDINVFFPET